jgi:hypothetical protein
MARVARRKSPSRIRYEALHPTVSFRVTRDIYDKVKAVEKFNGMSFADVFKVGLGILKVPIKDELEARKQSYAAGYKKGQADAESLYKVSYPCAVCRKTLTITSKAEKEAVKRYMQEHRWGHKECHGR